MSLNERLQADISAHIDGELPSDQAEKLEAHVAKTPVAKQEEEDLRRVVSQVRALEPIKAPSDFAAGVLTRVDDLVAARAARAMRPHRRRRRPPDPFAQDPFAQDAFAGDPAQGPDGFGPDPMCAPFAEDISAALDSELTPDEEAKLYRHLQTCGSCRALQRHLFEVSDLVQALPQIPTPLGFMTKITDRLDAERLEETRANLRIHHERRAWLTRLGRLAQAACFLIVAGGALALTTPDEQSLTGFDRKVASARPQRPAQSSRLWGKKRKNRPAAKAPSGPVVGDLQGKYDAPSIELETRTLSEGRSKARELFSLHAAKIEREVGGDKDAVGYEVRVAANKVDDLRDALARSGKLETPKAEAEKLTKVHTEYDQVLLKNGFVLVGVATQRDDGTYLIKVGDQEYEVDKADIARIDEAKATRRLKIVLRQRD